MTYRTAALQPWYHEPRPRCDVITLAKQQCLFSARYIDRNTGSIHLCKTHADLADFPVKLIRPNRVEIRDD